jgi:hypothetical protein
VGCPPPRWPVATVKLLYGASPLMQRCDARCEVQILSGGPTRPGAGLPRRIPLQRMMRACGRRGEPARGLRHTPTVLLMPLPAARKAVREVVSFVRSARCSCVGDAVDATISQSALLVVACLK